MTRYTRYRPPGTRLVLESRLVVVVVVVVLTTAGTQLFYSQYDSRYVGCHWLRLAPFLCTNLIGQGPELLTTPAARQNCGDC